MCCPLIVKLMINKCNMVKLIISKLYHYIISDAYFINIIMMPFFVALTVSYQAVFLEGSLAPSRQREKFTTFFKTKVPKKGDLLQKISKK